MTDARVVGSPLNRIPSVSFTSMRRSVRLIVAAGQKFNEALYMLETAGAFRLLGNAVVVASERTRHFCAWVSSIAATGPAHWTQATHQ